MQPVYEDSCILAQPGWSEEQVVASLLKLESGMLRTLRVSFPSLDGEHEDIIQETFWRVLKSWQRDPSRPLVAGFAFKTLRNCALTLRGRRQREASWDEAVNPLQDATDEKHQQKEQDEHTEELIEQFEEALRKCAHTDFDQRYVHYREMVAGKGRVKLSKGEVRKLARIMKCSIEDIKSTERNLRTRIKRKVSIKKPVNRSLRRRRMDT